MSGHFLENALVYLGAAVICVPVAKKLGLGSVLGYLLAGMIIGPYALGFIGEEGDDILHIAEFGVVIMLFLIGLELEPKAFWRMRKQVLGLGGWQLAVTTLLLWPLGMLLLNLHWTAALALALALGMSSTALVLQNMKEQGRMNTEAGKSAFAVLLFQDIAVIPILALLPLLASNPAVAAGSEAGWLAGLNGWAQAGLVLASIVGVVLAGRLVVGRVLQWVAATRIRELFVATALLLVVGVAVLMQAVGLSAALGAFLAGVVLANSAYRHELESDLDPFKGLLLGLFFMAVGASINFDLLQEAWMQVLLLVLGVMLVKGLILGSIGRFYRFGTDQNLVFAFGLMQVGEFAFVLLAFIGQLGLLGDQTLQLFTAVTALTMTLTPLFGLLNERILLPRLGTPEAVTEPDVPEEQHAVIIAGFGHFGSTVGRVLRANGVQATILDYDADQVELLRKMGFKVYYGDVTRVDLLELAGAEKAKIIISAIPNLETNLRLAEEIKKHYPHLRFFARARNRFDAYELMEHGVQQLYRETIDTSVRMGVEVLQALGHRAHSAHRSGQDFLRYDEAAMSHLALKKRDMKAYISSVRAAIAWQEEMLLADKEHSLSSHDHSWDSEAIRRNVLGDAPTN